MNPDDYSLIGYLGKNKVIAIPNSIRLNILILGELGSGKSSILRLLILQDILAGRGFLLAENHSELSREILSLIPEDQYHKIVYVNLGSIKRLQKTLRFNPLEIDDPHDAGIIALNFTECLAKAFSDSWGARVETCARNGSLAVIGTQSNTLGAMLKLLTDEEWADTFMPEIQNRQARDFFAKVYRQQYPKEAGGVIFNKLNKMLTIPEMDAMFNTQKSSISFADIIDNGMYVVLDFGGLPNDMVKFLGNIFLHLFYTQYKKRKKNSDGKYNTFNLYLDEVQMFSDVMIRELLNTVRKYGIMATVATQSITALGKELSEEIMTLCRAVACFRCDAFTANHLKSILPIKPDAQQQLSFHHFSFYAAGNKPESAIAQTRHMKIVDKSEQAEKASVQRLGTYVSLDKYYSQKGGNADVILTPLEFGILNLLRMENRDMSKDEIVQKIQRRYAAQPRMISSALHDTLIATNNFVAKHDITTDDGDAKFESRYSITKSAIQQVFSKAAAGRRAGGDLHLAAIFMNFDVQTNLGNYCVVDLGAGTAKQADLLIFSPQTIQDEEGKSILYHPSEWSEKVVAVEVETAPGKHWDQAIINWEKNTKLGYFVWFVVFSEKDRDGINNIFKEKGISPTEYAINVIDKESLLAAVAGRQISQYTEIESAVIKILINNGGTATQRYIVEYTWIFEESDVLSALSHLQEKNNLIKAGSGKNESHITWSLPKISKKTDHSKTDDDDVSTEPSVFTRTTPNPNDSTQYGMDDSNTHDDMDVTKCKEQKETSEKETTNYDDISDDDISDDDISDDTTKEHPNSKKSPLLDMTPEMLLYIWVDTHNDTDPLTQRNITSIESELKRREYIIKLRNGKFFLSKIPR